MDAADSFLPLKQLDVNTAGKTIGSLVPVGAARSVCEKHHHQLYWWRYGTRSIKVWMISV
jgi:hypothetical protein